MAIVYLVHITDETITDKSKLCLSYAKIGMKAKTFESRVFEMESSALKTEYSQFQEE